MRSKKQIVQITLVSMSLIMVVFLLTSIQASSVRYYLLAPKQSSPTGIYFTSNGAISHEQTKTIFGADYKKDYVSLVQAGLMPTTLKCSYGSEAYKFTGILLQTQDGTKYNLLEHFCGESCIAKT